jgi:hypothetical protein
MILESIAKKDLKKDFSAHSMSLSQVTHVALPPPGRRWPASPPGNIRQTGFCLSRGQAGRACGVDRPPARAADGLGRGNILPSWSVDLEKKILLDRGQ